MLGPNSVSMVGTNPTMRHATSKPSHHQCINTAILTQFYKDIEEYVNIERCVRVPVPSTGSDEDGC